MKKTNILCALLVGSFVCPVHAMDDNLLRQVFVRSGDNSLPTELTPLHPSSTSEDVSQDVSIPLNSTDHELDAAQTQQAIMMYLQNQGVDCSSLKSFKKEYQKLKTSLILYGVTTWIAPVVGALSGAGLIILADYWQSEELRLSQPELFFAVGLGDLVMGVIALTPILANITNNCLD